MVIYIYNSLKKLLYLPLAVVLLQSCSSGRSAASADIYEFAPDIGEFTDSRDGKTYKTTKIGTQIWMAENLNYNASESICYDDKIKNCDKYGRLYNWETAIKACPIGWHLPKNDEWDILIGYVGNTDKLKEINSWNPTWYSYMGKVMRKNAELYFLLFMISLVHYDSSAEFFLAWNGIVLAFTGFYSFIHVSISPSVNAIFKDIDNNYGFSALPGGYVESSTRKSVEIKKYGFWWTATETDSSDAYYRSLYYDMYNVVSRKNYKSLLLSVRCVMD